MIREIFCATGGGGSWEITLLVAEGVKELSRFFLRHLTRYALFRGVTGFIERSAILRDGRIATGLGIGLPAMGRGGLILAAVLRAIVRLLILVLLAGLTLLVLRLLVRLGTLILTVRVLCGRVLILFCWPELSGFC